MFGSVVNDDDPDQRVPPGVVEDIFRCVQIGGTFTAESVFGDKGNLGQVTELLASLNRDAAIEVCVAWSRQNSLIGLRGSCTEMLPGLICRFLPLRHRFRAELAAADNDFFQSPFSEISLLGLMALICRYSRVNGGGLVQTTAEEQALFRALLILQGGVFPPNLLDLPIPDQFRYTTSVILATVSTQNIWGFDLARLYALLCIPEVDAQLQARAGLTVPQWFGRRLGCPGEDYLAVVNTFLGAYLCGADLRGSPLPLRPDFDRFRDLCSTTPEQVVHGLGQMAQADPVEVYEATTYANRLVVRPVISLGDRYVVASPGLFFNKLHRGLPYLCLEARPNPGEDGYQPRAEFGYIFEGYVQWLLSQWFPPGQVYPNFVVDGGRQPPEQDAAVIFGDTALLFETKATVPPIHVRSLAEPGAVAGLLEVAARQLDRGAAAAGRAWRKVEGKALPLPRVSKVVPIAVVFEFFPVRWPYSDSFEKVLQASIGLPVFAGRAGVLPMQVLDIQDVELWDEFFCLPQEELRLVESLAARATSPLSRWRPLGRDLSRRDDFIERPGILRRLLPDAERFSAERLKAITG